MAGSEQNRKLGQYIHDKWISYKFDHVEMVQYDVLLSMPPRDKPNAVKIINTTDGSVLWNVQGLEKVRSPPPQKKKEINKIKIPCREQRTAL